MDEATSAPATSAPIWDPLGRILPFPVPALFDARLTATHHQVLLFMAYQSEHSPDGWFEIRQDDMARFLGKETRGAVSRKLLDLCHWPTTDNPYVLRFQQVHASSRMRRANRYRLRFDVSMEDIPPELRRIAPPTGQIPDDDGGDPILAPGLRPDQPVLSEYQHPAGGHLGRQHRLQHREGDARLVAKWRDPAVAGIEFGVGPGSRQERVMAAVIVPHFLAKAPIGTGAAQTFDPAVLVRRHGLGSQLAADPIGLLH